MFSKIFRYISGKVERCTPKIFAPQSGVFLRYYEKFMFQKSQRYIPEVSASYSENVCAISRKFVRCIPENNGIYFGTYSRYLFVFVLHVFCTDIDNFNLYIALPVLRCLVTYLFLPFYYLQSLLAMIPLHFSLVTVFNLYLKFISNLLVSSFRANSSKLYIRCILIH